jgi:hypothetical protein
MHAAVAHLCSAQPKGCTSYTLRILLACVARASFKRQIMCTCGGSSNLASQHLLTAALSRAQAIQTNCPWLLRYLVTAIILTKTSSNRRQNIMADLIKVLEQEQGNYSDPITDFLECLYVHFDFDGAMARCKECEQVRPPETVDLVQTGS